MAASNPATERAEKELRQLITKARKSMGQDLDTCIDWIDDELNKAKKICDQIEKIQRQNSGIDSKLFNDSRDCCDDLRNWVKRLTDHRSALLNNEQRFVVQTLDELGTLNDGFQRSRKILFTK